ncbi:nitric oxide reductase [Salmonella bongori]|nr:nitric oxide reductase [Salmonella bongori]
MPLLFSAGLRKEIVRRLREAPLPLWLFAVTACSYLISDTVEHHRLLSPIFLHNAHYTDLIEELYEVPFMIGLFMVTLGFMRQDKQHEYTALKMTPYHAK